MCNSENARSFTISCQVYILCVGQWYGRGERARKFKKNKSFLISSKSVMRILPYCTPGLCVRVFMLSMSRSLNSVTTITPAIINPLFFFTKPLNYEEHNMWHVVAHIFQRSECCTRPCLWWAMTITRSTWYLLLTLRHSSTGWK